MIIVTAWKLNKKGYRMITHRVLRVESVSLSDEDCDVLVVKTYGGEIVELDMNKYEVEVNVRTF